MDVVGGSVHDRCLPGAGVGVNGVGRIFKARLAAGAEGPRGPGADT